MEYELYMNSLFMVENEDFIIYSNQSLKSFVEKTYDDLNANKKRILEYFGIDSFRKVTLILYDNLNTFRKFVLSLREKDALLPDYATGVFDKGMISRYINPNDIKSDIKFKLKSKQNIHELIHIINQEEIYKDRVVWLDEGLATNLSGEKESLNDNKEFISFLRKKIIPIKNLPIMNNLIHGNNFINKDYNGYDLAYLCVRYLIETMTMKSFQNMLRNYDLSIETGKNVLQKAIEYYKEKVNLP